MVEKFYEIFKTDQMALKELVIDELYEQDYEPVVAEGFVYAEGDIPVLLVAHLDTVHKEIPKEIYYDKKNDVLWSPQGIGGDDRCGVWAILEIIKKHKPYVLFTEDEESGCIGARKAAKILKAPNVRMIIEIDRRGSEDCVFYDCGNKEFQEYIEKFGFKTAFGTFSDICELSSEWDIASVNLSSGYYNEHTLQEMVKIKEIIATRDKVIKILEDEDETHYDYQEVKYAYNYGYYNGYKTNKGNQLSLKEYTEADVTYEDGLGWTDKNGKWHWWDDYQ